MRRPSAFEIYLRTGLIPAGHSEPVELKFNPWHDEKTGRFTFAGQGSNFGGGSTTQTGARRSAASRPPRTQAGRATSYGRYDPRNPANYSVRVVKRGDTLTQIATELNGLAVADLAWLNGISPDQPLRVGQQLKLPNQSYLDAGRDAKNKFLALSYFMETHNGQRRRLKAK